MGLLTHDELNALNRKIDSLTKEQQQRRRDMREALSQSSETWHDNAPRDVLIDAAKVGVQSLTALTKIKMEAVMGNPEGNTNKIGLLTKFGLEDLESTEVDKYQLTGTGNFLEISDGVSCDSPIGKLVFGKEFFDSIHFRGKDFMIVPIEE